MRRARSGRDLRAALAGIGPGRAVAAALATTLAASLVLHGIARAADKAAIAQPGHERETAAVAYPSGYPRWTHLKSGLIAAGHPRSRASAACTTSTPTPPRWKATATAATPTARCWSTTCSKPATAATA